MLLSTPALNVISEDLLRTTGSPKRPAPAQGAADWLSHRAAPSPSVLRMELSTASLPSPTQDHSLGLSTADSVYFTYSQAILLVISESIAPAHTAAYPVLQQAAA